MQNLLALIAVIGLVSTAACKKDEKKADEPTTAEPTATDPKPMDPKPASPEMVNKMEHCPSSVEGSETKVADGEGVVMVHVTSKDEAAVTEIRKRATHLASLNDADSTEVKHSGGGTGGGILGKCPVAVGASMVAKVEAEDMEGGTKITLTPANAGGLADLSKMVKDRAQGMAAGGGMKTHEHGNGEGHGDHHGGDGSGGGAGTGGGTSGGGEKAMAGDEDEEEDEDEADEE